MVNGIKISQLNPASTLDGTESLPVVQNGVTVKATTDQIKTLSQTNVPAANITGTLGINHGGTGQTTANSAFNALAPSQTSNPNKFLKTDGTNTSWSTPSGSDVSIGVGLTSVTLGTSGRVLYDNAGSLGEYTISGTGSVAMTTSPAFTTPSLGVASGTSLALGGATIGTNALAVTGTTNISSDATFGGKIIMSANVIRGTSATQLSLLTNGNALFYDNAGTSFGLMQFGGTSASFPAIKRNGASLDFRLADDSNYAQINSASHYIFGSYGAFTTTALQIQSTNGNGYSGGIAMQVTPSGGGGPYTAGFIAAANTNNAGATDGGQLAIYTAAQDGSHTLTKQGTFDNTGRLTLHNQGLTLNGSQSFGTDNTYDIGSTSSSRPRYAYVGTGVFIGGASVTAGTGLSVLGTGANPALLSRTYNPAVSVNATNYLKAISAINWDLNIAAGVTDSGYRIGLDSQSFISDANFLGTLATQYGAWIRHGANVSGAGSVITNSYGVYIDSLTNVNTTITNLWGLYQNNSSAVNYFAGKVGIGTTSPGTNALAVTGTAAIGSLVNIDSSGRLLVGVSAPSQSSAERFEVKGGMSLLSYSDTAVASVYVQNTNTTAATIQPYIYLNDGTGNRGGFGVQSDDSSVHIYAHANLNLRVGASGLSAARQVQISGSNSAVNYLVLSGAITAGNTTITATGSDTDVGMNIVAKGVGSINFQGGNTAWNIMQLASAASSVNGLKLTAQATGNDPAWDSVGTDTNIGMRWRSKGTGAFNWFTNAGNDRQFQITNTTSAVNYLTVTGSTTGNAPTITAAGSDTNISISLVPKGTGTVTATTLTLGGATIGTNALAVTGTADFSGAVTAVGLGSSTNVIAGSTSQFYWTSRSTMQSPVNGNIMLANYTATDFGRLQFGGTTSSFPAIKRNAAAINFRLADDSADAAITAASISGTGIVTASSGTAIAAGGVNTAGFKFSSTANFGMFFGSGAPTLSAAQGSLYLRSDGTPYYNSSVGSGTTWTQVGTGGGGASISNDTTTTSNLYPLFADATTGTPTTIYTGNANLLYKPSTGEHTARVPIAGNGIFVNALTIASNYTIASGYSGTSAGPITVASGVAVTISSGSKWVVL
jgi:hypothetical protein